MAVFDLEEPQERDKDSRVAYYTGDLCDEREVLEVLAKVSN